MVWSGFLPTTHPQQIDTEMIDEKFYQPSEVEGRIYAALGSLRPRSRVAGPNGAMQSLSVSSFPRRTLPVRCIWGMPSTTRCRTSSAGSSACAARTCSGSPALTMPVSRHRWLSSAS